MKHLFTDDWFCSDISAADTRYWMWTVFITPQGSVDHADYFNQTRDLSYIALPLLHKCKDGDIADYIWEEKEMGQLETTAGGLANAVAINMMIGV